MTLKDRLQIMYKLFNNLEHTPSRNEKLMLIEEANSKSEMLKEDLGYCFEILSGMHKVGYTVDIRDNETASKYFWYDQSEMVSLKEFVQPFFNLPDKSVATLRQLFHDYSGYGFFLNPLFNRAWRLGINRSQLSKEQISPMLAKKFDPEKIPGGELETYTITEKLDGNRCIAKYNFQLNQWEFYSRSGKRMKVAFDTDGLSSAYIYDGEILSRSQISSPGQRNFNTLSGAINSKSGDKSSLVYMIFDVVEPELDYAQRRQLMEMDTTETDNVKILPRLGRVPKKGLVEAVTRLLEVIESRGGEGVMVNLESRTYEQKRTDALLKVKSTYTMDMRVIEVLPGTGKFEGCVGSLECVATDKQSGRIYTCNVGSGLSEAQRELWGLYPEQIVGKIVEVAYFSISQSKLTEGTNMYSLRFPRFKKVRNDKEETSVD